MIITVFCERRSPNVTLDEFSTHWREVHSQMVNSIKIRRYVQYHTLANDPTPKVVLNGGESFDGFAVLWWDSVDAFCSGLNKKGIEDNSFFMDLSRSPYNITQEHVIVEPEGFVPYVFIECMHRRSDIDRAKFQKAWLQYGEFARQAHAQGLIKGYIQYHTLEAIGAEELREFGSPEESYDGFGFVYFESVAKFKAITSQLFTPDVIKEEKKFLDHSKTVFQLTRRDMFKAIIR